ncbi:phenylacetate--CoA ligase family protein [Niallia sp. 03133]|uniref:phenylacetate--CoA ligase family protein n=1 Tax=Niallia sp. 03133 TaxID=3458060 RepID=UPI0040439E2A
MPFTFKEELRNTSPLELLAVSRKEISHYHESSGTTGHPSFAWFTQEDMKKSGEQINSAGIKLTEDDLILIRFPFALFLPGFLIQQAAYQVGAGIVPASSRNSVTTYPKIVKLLKNLDCTVLAGLPREMELLAETARLSHINIADDFKRLRGILVAGELLTPSRRAHIESLWGKPVYNLFGSTETGNIASMCSHGSLHFSEQDYFIEVYGDQLKHPVEYGEKGMAVITTLANQAFPLLRYVNEDIVSLHKGECPCGSHEIELRHYGRISERQWINQQLLDAYDFQEAVYTLPTVPVAWRFDIVNNGVDAVMEFNEAVNEQTIKSHLADKLNVSINLIITRANELLDRSTLLDETISKKPQYISKKRRTTNE